MSFSLLLTIGLTLVFVASAAGLTARSRSARPLVMGLGMAAVPVGLFLTGVTDLTLNGIASLVDWFGRTEFTNLTAWGLGLALGGLALAVGGSFLPKATKSVEAPQQPQVSPKAAPQQGAPGTPQVSPGSAKGAAKPQQTGSQPAAQKGLDPEDAEIEALLRKRGIM